MKCHAFKYHLQSSLLGFLSELNYQMLCMQLDLAVIYYSYVILLLAYLVASYCR
uniref:Uncharacterized protein n=1 Tax=Rhizophora mucronata TaxID=61149 RepID=A0A2P2NZ66_RHIMU